MKTILDKATCDELITRINTLNENSKPQWGQMSIHQMLRHCTRWEEMVLGRLKCKRIFLGRLIGRMILKKTMKDDTPMMKNAVTSHELIVDSAKVNIDFEKKKWIALLEEDAMHSNNNFIHPFFGKMTKEQIGIHAYKHTDHHLRQFNG